VRENEGEVVTVRWHPRRGARRLSVAGERCQRGCCPMKVTTPGSLTGWAHHLSERGRRRPNRTSRAGVSRIEQAEQATAESDKWSRRWADWARQGGRRWAVAELENKEEARPKIRKKEFLN
jgi:hypothetical protein